jgi:hypothetical protein
MDGNPERGRHPVTPAEFFAARRGWLVCAHLVLSHDNELNHVAGDGVLRRHELNPIQMRHLWTEALACQRRDPLQPVLGTRGEVLGWLLRAWCQAVDGTGADDLAAPLWPLVATAARIVAEKLDPLDALPDPGVRWKDRKDLEG